MVAPIIPAINDAEIERILDAAAAAGVTSAGYVLLRLPLEVRDLFKEWLMANFPDKYRHVMSLIRQSRDGKDYDAEWGKRMKGGGPYAWMIGRGFRRPASGWASMRRSRPFRSTSSNGHARRRAAQLNLF